MLFLVPLIGLTNAFGKTRNIAAEAEREFAPM